MKNTLETRLGIFFALALIAAVLIMELAGGFDIFTKGLPVRARFENIQDLKVGDDVKMAGVPIGRVEKISIVDNKVEISMKLKADAQVRTSSKATVKFVGLMGQNYVSVDFGTPGSPIVTANAELLTVEQPDFSSLMAKLDGVAEGVEGLTKNFSGDSLGNMMGPITDFLKDNSPRLTAILGNMQNISGQIAQGQGTVGKLIMDDALYNTALLAVTNLNETAADIKLTLGQAQEIVTGINEGKGTLGRLAKDEALYSETTVAMTNLKEILQKINQGQGSVGKLVNDEAFYKNVKLTLQKLDKATEGLEDQGPLSVIGLAVGSLF